MAGRRRGNEDDELARIMGEFVFLLVMGDRRAGVVIGERLAEQRAESNALAL